MRRTQRKKKGSRVPRPSSKETSAGEATAPSRTLSGLPVDVAVGPGETSYATALGLPGEPPFTRGIRATMYRGRLWTMRQYAGFGTAEETNRRFRYLLSEGNEGLSVAFDLPTQMGYDSDARMARGEVGNAGVAISTLDDMDLLFRDIPLDRVSTSMTINATAPVLLALYVTVASRARIPRKLLRGTVQNDILKEYIARSTYIFPPDPSMRLAVDLIEFCAREMPKWNAISVSGYHIREAGATAAQELAFTLGDAIAYLDAAVARGLRFDAIAPQVSFFFNAHVDLFEEVAKFRAARRMWSRIAQERYRARDAESRALRFHAQTSGAALTAQQPENNAVRVAIQALAAVLGGAQSVHTNSMDEALALPSEKAVRLALRTQQVLAHETGVANTVDPAGGSFHLEALTDRIEEEAWSILREVERRGGMPAAIGTGWVQQEVAESAYRFQLEVERGERHVVGVNVFAEGRASRTPPRAASATEASRRKQLEAYRRSRDSAAARRALDVVARSARGDENLVPPILGAVGARATLGEISDALREAFGTYRPREVT